MRRRWLDGDLSRLRFTVTLVVIALVGALIRVVYVRGILTTKSFGFDSTWYYLSYIPGGDRLQVHDHNPVSTRGPDSDIARRFSASRASDNCLSCRRVDAARNSAGRSPIPLR